MVELMVVRLVVMMVVLMIMMVKMMAIGATRDYVVTVLWAGFYIVAIVAIVWSGGV